ncbi:MAG: hypothetical protein JW894_05275 [Bacteroidales bacterium]|nr:hypothetical protein [Bacteroidales bacterium]
MRKNFPLFLTVITLSAALISCGKDDNSSGSAGYRGAYIGTWAVDETYIMPESDTLTDNYVILITAHPDEDSSVYIYNLGDVSPDFEVEAKVTPTAMTIPSQTITLEYLVFHISGSGEIEDETLTFSYNMPGYWTAECTATKN